MKGIKKAAVSVVVMAMLCSTGGIPGQTLVSAAFSKAQSVTAGSRAVLLENGVYAVNAKIFKVDQKTESMSDSAITHTVKVTVKDGSYDVTLNFKGMTIGSIYGYLGTMKYYSTGYTKDAFGNPVGMLTDVTVNSVQKYKDGSVVMDQLGANYPDLVTFPLIQEALEDGCAPMQIYVPIMEAISAGNGTQNAYLKLDWSSAQKTSDDDLIFFSEDVVAEKAEDSNQETAISAPKSPSSIKAASVAYHKIKITWNKVDGASGYEVYQNQKKIADVTGTNYTKTGLVTGTRYTYKVRAYKMVSGKKVYSGDSKTVSAKPQLSKVTGVKAKNSSKRAAKITWKKVSGANGYVIYRAAKSNGKYKAVKTISKGTAATYTNKKLTKKKYYYKVRAYRKVGKKKVYADYSKTVAVKVKK